MKCKEYLDNILKRFEKHGDCWIYDKDLEQMRYICEDYDEYIESLRQKDKN